MSARKVTTAATMAVLVVVLGTMAVVGFRAATAPLPGRGSTTPTCTPAEKAVKTTLSRPDVQVSVFNASRRGGLAGTTLDKIEAAGFRAGNAGNAPAGAKVANAVVWTTKRDDPAARLVALAFGRRTRIVVTATDLGPGIDVLVGDRFKGLDRKAARRIKLPAPVETCVPVK